MLADVRPALASVDELVAGAVDRVPMTTVGKSGALLERVRLGDDWLVLKHLDPSADWTLRWAAVPGSATLDLWRRGVLDALPDCLHQPVVAVASDGTISWLLVRDVGGWLVPADHSVIPVAQHEQFLDHMAALHAAFWERPVDVVPPGRRYLELSPEMVRGEIAAGSTHLVPQLVLRGWPLLGEVAPGAAAVVTPLLDDPRPPVDAVGRTPQTFVHGNWKLDNLGTTPDGRTVVLDWELPGRGAGASDLAWYLAMNCRRIPTSKEDAIATYRDALERHGVATDDWWDTQRRLSLVGALVQFGWEKALGGCDDELAWWGEQVVRAAPLLDR